MWWRTLALVGLSVLLILGACAPASAPAARSTASSAASDAAPRAFEVPLASTMDMRAVRALEAAGFGR